MIMDTLYQLNQVCLWLLTLIGKQVLYSGVIFILVLSVTALLKIRNPFWLIILWALVVWRMILPPAFSSPVAVWSILEKILPFDGMAEIHWPWPENLEDTSSLTTALNRDLIGVASEKAIPWYLFITMTWLSGTTGLFIIFLKNHRKRRNLLLQAEEITDPHIISLMAEWRRRLAIPSPIRLVSHDSMMSPFTMGWRRPVICLPAAFLQHQSLESVLAHEMAHIKRQDSLVLRIQTIITIVYFFNPLIWIAGHKINFYRECLCDQLVLRTGRLDPALYGNRLLEILHMIVDKPAFIFCSPGLGHYHKELKQRFQLLKGGPFMHFTSKWHRFVIMGVLAVTLLPFSNSLLTHSVQKNMSSQMAAASVPGESQDSNAPAATTVQFVNPLPSGKKTVGFGPAPNPFTGKEWQHIGIDLKAKLNTPVQACADGTIIKVQNEYTGDDGRGKDLIVQHRDGFSSRYSHLNSIKVKVGDSVSAGDVIAAVGSTGRSTGPHLHFEVMRDGKPVDPEEYIKFK
jgi:beta-lactamase regulating signal transducer with metallopeptidase domain